MNWWKKGISKFGGKTIASEAIERNFTSSSRPYLASALSIVLVACLLLAVTTAQAADPGHAASRISSGTFESGNYVFPNNMSVTQNFSVATNTLFVEAVLGRVGIGTSTPNYLFEVAEGTEDAVNLSGVLYVNGTSGNVGIGTNNPDKTLHVDGDIIISKSSGNTNLFLRNAGGANNTIIWWDNGTGDHVYYLGQTEDGGLLRFYNDIVNLNQLVLDTSGNVGIGTINPTTRLDVNGSMNITDSGGRIRTPELCLTGDSCRTTWPTGGDGGEGWATSGGYVYNATATGVGIGTAIPADLLTVVGTVNATDFQCDTPDCIGGVEVNETDLNCTKVTGSLDLCDDDDTCSSEGCTVGSDDTLNDPTVAADINMSNFLIEDIGNANTDFTSGGGLTLNGNLGVLGSGTNTIAGHSNFDGNTLFVNATEDSVGIGTAAVGAAKLTIDAADASSAIYIRNSTGSNRFAINPQSDGSWIMYDYYGDSWNQGIAQQNGNVGIGTASPSGDLEVSASAAELKINSDTNQPTQLLLKAAGFDRWGLIRPANTFDLTIYESQAGQYRLYIEEGGQVGIGTTSPDAKLEILNETTPQFRISHTDGVDYGDFAVDSDGNLTISSSSGNVIIQLG